ncbi:hypothetical protein ACFW04_012637 [Cataglyphis niger]
MASQIPEEVHIRHCMLFEFSQGYAIDAFVNAKGGFLRFGNFDLSDSYRPGRPTTLDNDMLRTEVKANPCQTIEKLSNTLNQPWSTIQEHLQQMAVVLSELPRSTAKSGLYSKKALLLLKPGQTVNEDLYCEQLDRVNQSLIEKYPAIVNKKGVILQHDNARPYCARRILEKINELGWEVLPHPSYSPDIAPSNFHLFRSLQHFYVTKNLKIWMIFKMPSPDILLKTN